MSSIRGGGAANELTSLDASRPAKSAESTAIWRATWNNASSNRLPIRFQPPKGMSGLQMPYSRKRPLILWSFPFLIFLGGCDAKPECDSFETRNAVLKIVSDDHNNALIEYAAKNSNATKSSDANSEAEKSKQQQPLYPLGEKIVTTSTSENKRTLKM